MPVHDWTRVTPGVFHDFHLAWVVKLWGVLNQRLLPSQYYAHIELCEHGRAADPFGLWTPEAPSDLAKVLQTDSTDAHAARSLMDAPPRVGVCDTVTEAATLAMRRRRIVIRRSDDDHAVTLIETVTPGSKQTRGVMERFVDKVVAAFDQGLHVILIDLFPPGPFDSEDMHAAIWRRAGGAYDGSPDKPLTIASYRAAGAVTCYVEPIAVGQPLPPMPLFLDPGHYINVPLQESYDAAWGGMPSKWRRVLDRGEK